MAINLSAYFPVTRVCVTHLLSSGLNVWVPFETFPTDGQPPAKVYTLVGASDQYLVDYPDKILFPSASFFCVWLAPAYSTLSPSGHPQ
jgi:hypothetical protein